MNMTPAARLAAALDAVAPDDAVPGSDDLVDSILFDPFIQVITDLDERAGEVKAALQDVLLGPVIDESGKRANTGINTYIKHQIPVPIIRLAAWQERLRQALEKL